MTSKFQGFDDKGKGVPSESGNTDNSDSNADGSERESPVTSTDSTPTKSTLAGGSQVNTASLKASAFGVGNVKRLTEYFSSDSEATEARRPATRRKKSGTSVHQELPLGGERELRKRMATQEAANESVELWQAYVLSMKASLDEAQQALDQNKSIPILKGAAAEIEALEGATKLAWDGVKPYLQDPTIQLTKTELYLAETKNNARCRRMLAHINAVTDIAPPVPAGKHLTLKNPTTFGDLALPEFNGDFTIFDSFEANWRGTISNGDLDEGAKKAYLLRSLKGEAKDFIGEDGLATKTYEEIWQELKGKYGKPWRITRAAVKKIMDIKDPSDSPKDISRYYNEIVQACKVVERLKLTASSILLNMCLLKLPVDFRAKMDDRLRPLSPEYILSRDLMAEPFNDVIAGELEKPTSIVATVGFNTIPQGNINKQFNQGYKNNNNSNKGQKQYKKCLLCSKGKGNHKSYHCPVYNTGLLARERIKALGRCQYYAVVLSEHGQECSHRVRCAAHPNQRHMFWLCANYINFTAKLGNQINPPHQQQYHHPQQNQY